MGSVVPLATSIGNPGAPAYTGPTIAGKPDPAWLAEYNAVLIRQPKKLQSAANVYKSFTNAS